MEDSVAFWAPVFVYIGIAAGAFEFSKVYVAVSWYPACYLTVRSGQAFFLGIAGEELTARLRRMTFRAMLRQVCYHDFSHVRCICACICEQDTCQFNE